LGLFESIFGKKPKNEGDTGTYFKMLTGYQPVYRTYEGGVYEMELTRAAIHAFSTHVSKLMPEVNGSAYTTLAGTLKHRPNAFMNTSQFLYRVATILAVNNTAFIVPIEDAAGWIIGYYPILPQAADVVESAGQVYLRYTFGTGQKAAVEISRVGVLTTFQYKNDFFGETNAALQPTMELINAQNQGIVEGIKNGATIRFLAKLANLTKPKDVKRLREDFIADNLGSANNSGIIIYGSEYSDIKTVDSKSAIINPSQMQLIQENVFNYFGVNKKILQNDFDENAWNAFYEGKIEPFSLLLSLAMTNMTFTPRELSTGNEILWTANRMQYASNQTKLSVSTQLFDRGLLNRNQVMDIWNMSHVEGGDKYYIRKEYTEVNQLGKEGSLDIVPTVPDEPDSTGGIDPNADEA
jgi:hypothetical protein